MEDNDISLSKIRRKEITNRIVFVILCVLIALLLTFNIITITNAYFTDSKNSNSSVVITGNVKVQCTVYEHGTNTERTAPIQMPEGSLMPGQSIYYDLKIENVGNNSCYVRIKAKFEILINGNFVENDIVVMSQENELAQSQCFNVNGVYYYNNANSGVLAHNNNITLPIKFTVNETINNELSTYSDNQYRITVYVQALQSQGVQQLNTENQKGWYDLQGHVIDSFE